jgi:perosamine synthetase
MTINFFSTSLNKSIIKKLNILFKKGFISSGKKSDEFEYKFSKTFGLKNTTAVNSGTSALHLSLLCANINAGDEVILPAQTFIATALVVKYCGAKVVFADIQKNTGNICPISIKKKISNKTKAIIVVHWGGYPCDMEEILKIAKSKNIKVIEDAAHALGSKYKNKMIGNISDFTCFSFQAKKQLTTGDGGMLVCKNIKDHKEAQKLKWFGINRSSKKQFQGERLYNLNVVGYKYHLNDIASTIGLENLKVINKKLNYLKYVADFYNKNLSNIQGIKLLEKKTDRYSTNWLYTILVEKRKKFFDLMKKNQIPVSLVHRGIDRNKIFGGLNKKLKNQRYFDDKHICLPIHEQLTKKNLNKIVYTIKKNF